MKSGENIFAFKYRSDIDGLRAVAVVSVLVYHAFPKLLPGGFIGVDIFFVISGFLITSIIQKEIQLKEFSIRQFYARRVKRLFPALLTMLIVTLGLGWLILLKHEFQQLGIQSVAGLLFVSNLQALSDTGYFTARSELKPLLHLWSLGIEEQFYFFWPLILSVVARYRLSINVCLLILIIASIYNNIILLDDNISAAFFLPSARFWELMLGGMLAVNITKLKHIQSLVLMNNVAACLGVLLIIIALFTIDKTKLFPGWWALMPVVGAVLLIASGDKSWLGRRVLSNPIVVFIGIISYPLYLWHWPLLAYLRFIYTEVPPIEARLGVLFISVVLSWLTYKFIELPLKARPSNGASIVKRLLILAFCILIVSSLVALGKADVRLKKLSSIVSVAHDDWNDRGYNVTLKGDNNESAVLFFGDSFIQQYFPRLKYLSTSDSINTNTIIISSSGGCAPFPSLARKTRPKCLKATKLGFEQARQKNVSTVVVGASWLGALNRGDFYYVTDTEQLTINFDDIEQRAQVYKLLENELVELQSSGKLIYLILTPPGHEKADPSYLLNRWVDRASVEVKSVTIREHKERVSEANKLLIDIAMRRSFNIIDPADWVCRNDNCYFTDEKGIPLYKDATHFRRSFAECCILAFDAIVENKEK